MLHPIMAFKRLLGFKRTCTLITLIKKVGVDNIIMFGQKIVLLKTLRAFFTFERLFNGFNKMYLVYMHKI